MIIFLNSGAEKSLFCRGLPIGVVEREIALSGSGELLMMS